jgi:chloramphenicol-sensitive protein RarD
MGFIQYVSPTCQLLLAVFAFGEPFTRAQAISFSLIWAALGIFSVDSVMALRRLSAPALESAASASIVLEP